MGVGRVSRHHARLNAPRWEQVRRIVFARDNYRCVECGRSGKLECDHIKPMRRGGDPWAVENLQALCRRCHVEKSRGDWRPPPTAAEREWRSFVDELVKDPLI